MRLYSHTLVIKILFPAARQTQYVEDGTHERTQYWMMAVQLIRLDH